MAAALLRGGSGLCVRCVHRELCRVVWRPQVALFSSGPSDRKQPRMTHVKKAKPQPAVDINELLEKLFTQKRPSAAPPAAGKARPTKASSVPTKPPTTSSMTGSTSNIPPLSKTEPAVSAFSAASSSKQTDEPKSASPTTPSPSESHPQSPLNVTQACAAASPPASGGSQAAAVEAAETKVETAAEQLPLTSDLPLSATEETSSSPASTVEPLTETTVESPAEPSPPPVEAIETTAPVAEGLVEPTAVSHTAKEESSVETTVEPPAESSLPPVEALETGASDVEGLVEPTVDVPAASHTAKEEPSVETTVEPPVESILPLVEAAETRTSPVEPTIDAAAQEVQAKSTDSGVVDVSHAAKEEPLIETTVESPVESSLPLVETLETSASVVQGPVEPSLDAAVDTAAQEVQTSTTDSGNVDISYTVEPVIETTVESPVETSPPPEETPETRAAAEGAVGSTVEAETDTEAQAEPFIETRVEAAVEAAESTAAVSEGPTEPTASEAEAMTLESVTLAEVKAEVGNLEAEVLQETCDSLEKEAEKLAKEEKMEVETTAEDVGVFEDTTEAEMVTIDYISEATDAIEAETAVMMEAMFGSEQGPKQPTDTPLSDQKLGAQGELMGQEAEKESSSVLEAMSLESVTLAEVEASLGTLERETLSETTDYLEKEADKLAKEKQMLVETTTGDVDIFEDTAEADGGTLDSISEATDAIEAETAVMLEVMFGSEQGPKQPADAPPSNQELGAQGEMMSQEAEKESSSVLEAMSLESVTLAEVEASLGTLERETLSETTDYLEKEAEILAGEERVEVEEGTAPEDTSEDLNIEALSLPEADVLSEDLQTDELMEELLFTVPQHVDTQIGQEVVRADTLEAAAVESETVETDDRPAPPAAALGLEVAEEGGIEEDAGKHTGLDPVQKLFLEKIREYSNMSRLNGGLLEAEPDYQKYLSEETAKLQRLYGGGDLNSFPQFTFTEPEMDQDSK